jgi:hypothetical protein
MVWRGILYDLRARRLCSNTFPLWRNDVFGPSTLKQTLYSSATLEAAETATYFHWILNRHTCRQSVFSYFWHTADLLFAQPFTLFNVKSSKLCFSTPCSDTILNGTNSGHNVCGQGTYLQWHLNSWSCIALFFVLCLQPTSANEQRMTKS